MAGGTGATTLAINLAWELVTVEKDKTPRVCILDFDLQCGNVSTYLDLDRREAVYELLSDTESMDSDAFMQTLLAYNEKLHVFTAPSDMLPLDLVEPEDIQRLIGFAASNFDYVIVDMPSTVVAWTENRSAVRTCLFRDARIGKCGLRKTPSGSSGCYKVRIFRSRKSALS